jgi:hypothetical protein
MPGVKDWPPASPGALPVGALEQPARFISGSASAANAKNP